MSLSTLVDYADAVIAAINSPPEDHTWSGYKAEGELAAQFALDPIAIVSQEQDGVWVIPMTMEYSKDASQGRSQMAKLAKQPVISIVVSLSFKDSDHDGIDVSNEEEIKKVLRFREEIDKLVIKQMWEHGIQDITTEAAQDIELKRRWYLCVSEITFESFSC